MVMTMREVELSFQFTYLQTMNDITPESQLYQDMVTLDSLFQELCWEPSDELIFTHDGENVIIKNRNRLEGR